MLDSQAWGDNEQFGKDAFVKWKQFIILLICANWYAAGVKEDDLNVFNLEDDSYPVKKTLDEGKQWTASNKGHHDLAIALLKKS